MKRIICTALFVALCMGLLTGCSKKTDVDTSTVFIEKKGNIVSVDVESLDKEYYDEEELEGYITQHVLDYADESGGDVEKVSFAVEEGTAKLQMKYGSYEDYSGFNGIEFYSGTVLTAQAQGYDFETGVYSVPDDLEEAKKSASKEDVLADDDSKVAVIKANVNVRVPGKVLFVSGEDTEVLDKNTVSITGSETAEEASLTYIVYK